jgi:hypothetical protein
MPSARIVARGREQTGAATRLLAARQRRLRALRPELPAAYQEPKAHLAELGALLDRHVDERIAWADARSE